MITMVIVLVILGVALWFIETYVPMSPPFKVLIRIVIILFSTLWLLSAFGLINTPNLR